MVKICRGGQTRTDDLLVPNQAYYQTVLHPEIPKNDMLILNELTGYLITLFNFILSRTLCGERGIRTPDTVARAAV